MTNKQEGYKMTETLCGGATIVHNLLKYLSTPIKANRQREMNNT